jgi:predicted transcriptional regulator
MRAEHIREVENSLKSTGFSNVATKESGSTTYIVAMTENRMKAVNITIDVNGSSRVRTCKNGVHGEPMTVKNDELIIFIHNNLTT